MKKIFTLMLAAFMLLALSGCGDSKPQQGSVQQKVMRSSSKQEFEPVTEVKEGRKNVYAVLKVIKGAYWQEVVRGLKEGGEAANVNVYVGGVMKDGDWELQRDMLKELSGKKVDAVVLAPADSVNMTESAKQLREQKLPVALVDTMLSSNDYDAAFMTNNLEAGEAVCKKMVEQLKANGVKETDKANVLIHLSTLASRTISDRAESVVANWAHYAPVNWKLVPEYVIDYGDAAGAVQLITDRIKNTPDVKGVISCNNSSTNATVEAIMQAGRKDIAITGFDLGKKTVAGFEDGNYNIAVAVQNQYKMGYDAVMAAAAAANGSKPAVKDTNTGIKLVDKTNYKK